ncbi:hypothetical protein F2Q69_00031006 [Brassica cretica]|uniref:Uncharacterized protein n=1 Tax=Brassica cretica TaxID=69181 RepID=A0A8S9RY78_BRACR|nr:hypothetical protein F2Q69_00031006 [Brassica cretica]
MVLADRVDLGSLPDTVPTDRIVVLQGGWSLFGKGSAGEILLRLTYKAYVEDEEDDKRNAKAINADASDDEMSDSEEPSSFVRDKIPSDDLGPESFMNVLSALILSEEFQGIVSSEAGNKLYEGEASVPPVPSKATEDSKSQPDDSGNGGISDLEVKTPSSDRSSVDDGGLALLWFSVITSVLVLVAINMGGSSFFNPLIHSLLSTLEMAYNEVSVLCLHSNAIWMCLEEQEYKQEDFASLSTQHLVDLGSLPDTVPTDRIVVLQGGWSLFGKGSAGEILLRLTYKAYVEDEEDDKRNAKAINADASDDDMSDSEEPSSFVRDKIPSDDLGPESFMNVLSALILSEEFQGIVSSEAGNKLYEGEASVPPVPSKASEDSKSQPDDSGNGGISDLEVKTPSSDRSSVDDGGLALLWFSVITSVLVLVAINMGGSSFFNP